MVPDTSLQTSNHLLSTHIVNYGVDCKFAINKKNIKVNMDSLVISPSIPEHNIDMNYFKENSKHKWMQT
jgi:hypothetical protein